VRLRRPGDRWRRAAARSRAGRPTPTSRSGGRRRWPAGSGSVAASRESPASLRTPSGRLARPLRARHGLYRMSVPWSIMLRSQRGIQATAVSAGCSSAMSDNQNQSRFARLGAYIAGIWYCSIS
jgi:hypothetical protein